MSLVILRRIYLFLTSDYQPKQPLYQAFSGKMSHKQIFKNASYNTYGRVLHHTKTT